MAEEFPYIPPVDPNIGRRVDTYFVLRKLLGMGGMGAAYLAEHQESARLKCVIKLVLAGLAHHPIVISRWSMEAQALSLLSHDNIVKLHSFGKLEDGQLFMRFELINGISLSRYVADQGGRISVRDAAYIFFQICDALDYAHSCGVVHRDLKPDNLMIELDPRGWHLPARVKVLDFGIAKVASPNNEQTGAGLALGTPGFMSPEQASNASTATDKADVFSLAVVFFFAVTGELPWGIPESDVDSYHKQKTEAPKLPPSSVMPAAVTKVIFRALSLRPDDRPTMREFALLLAAAIAEEGRLPSGTEILREVIRDWRGWALFAPATRTLPRPTVDPEGTPPELPASGPVGDADLAAAPGAIASPDPTANVGPTEAKRKRRPQNDLEITARGRPRAIAASIAAANAATFQPAISPAASMASSPSATTSKIGSINAGKALQPLIAALPTGLASQQLAAQVMPDEIVRAPSIVVASEFEMAVGTPTPTMYAADELPAVLVSVTLLERTERPTAPEAAPIVILPEVMKRAKRRAVIATCAAACVFAGLISFVLMRRSAAIQDDAPAAAVAPLPEVPRLAPEVRATQTPSKSAGSAERTTEVRATQPPSKSAGSAEHATSDVVAQIATPTAPTAVPAKPSPVHVDGGSLPSAHDAKPASISTSAPAVPPTGNTPSPAKVGASPARGASTAKGPAARPEEAAPGTVKVLVRPWALVYLDGRQLDQTPLVQDGISPGRHRVRLVNAPAQKDETVTITVAPGQVTTIERTW